MGRKNRELQRKGVQKVKGRRDKEIENGARKGEQILQEGSKEENMRWEKNSGTFSRDGRVS